MFLDRDFTERFFHRVVARPALTLAAGLLIIGLCAAGLTRLVKDTSVEAFIPDDHPSVLANDRAEELFGISKPLAVAVMTTDGGTVFRPEVLALVREVTERVAALPNIRPDRVASIATESSIRGEEGAVYVERYVGRAGMPAAGDVADAARRWRSMPPHVDALVSDDESGAVIMAELIDDGLAAETYEAVRQLAREYDGGPVELLVAGPAAVSGYLGAYIDRDARKLQPLVFLLVLGFIYLAFRRTTALLGPVFVILGSAGGALGLMAWAGTPYFAITNALPVILVAISVADAIHILTAYYVLRAQHPEGDVREQVVHAMAEMARPITLTTLTTMAGFAGIGIASIMPPITWFAWYAMLGVALAWVFSVLALPNALVLLKPAPSPAFADWRMRRPDPIGRLFARIGARSSARPGLVLGTFALLVCVAAAGALQLRVDRSQVENFAPDEPVRIADERINERFAGTAFLDVIVEADEPEGLLTGEAMERILALQTYFESLPHVRKTVSIADYIGLLHGAIEASGTTRVLPTGDDAVGQYLFLYEVTGDPGDLAEEIDGDYRTALVRGVLDAHYYSQTAPTVAALKQYVDKEFDGSGLTATLAGDVNIGYHWMSRLQDSHFLSVGLSLAMVLVISCLTFGRIWAGVIALLPVSFTVLVLYGVMGYLGVFLEPATSMFAAISVGVGVDFAIHLIDRLRHALRACDDDLNEAIALAMPGTARACFFNAAALGLGFAVLLTSELPTLQRFGGLVTVAAFASFLTALFIVPALFAVRQRIRGRLPRTASASAGGGALALVFLALTFTGLPAESRADEPTGREIAERVASRPEGEATRRLLQITVEPRSGRVVQRTAVIMKLNDEETRRTRITYTAPKMGRGTAFLVHDRHAADAEDLRWLYTPATRKTRRIPAGERWKSFQGTDFSFGDMQSELKFDLADYEFRYGGREDTTAGVRHRLSGKPRSDAIAAEIGYGGFEAVIDGETWLPVSIDFADVDGRALKTVTVAAVENIDGYWTATRIEAVNHQTESRTVFDFETVEYLRSLQEQLFRAGSLQRPLPGY